MTEHANPTDSDAVLTVKQRGPNISLKSYVLLYANKTNNADTVG